MKTVKHSNQNQIKNRNNKNQKNQKKNSKFKIQNSKLKNPSMI